MNRHLEFIFGLVILFFMAVVLWKVIEPRPVTEVITPAPTPSSEEEDVIEPGVSFEGEGLILPNPPVPDEAAPDITTPEPAPAEESPEQPVACTMDAKMCPDGSYVGRVGPNCEFATCPQQAGVSRVFTCSLESRNDDACVTEVDPVCGSVQVECITAPCNPVPETFSNSCFACANMRTISYTKGACGAVTGE